MGWRFRRSIRLPGGIRLNASNRGLGASAGVRGARVSLSPTGRVTRTISIPGTGISNVQQIGQIGGSPPPRQVNATYNQPPPRQRVGRGISPWMFIVGGISAVVLMCCCGAVAYSSMIGGAIAVPTTRTFQAAPLVATLSPEDQEQANFNATATAVTNQVFRDLTATARPVPTSTLASTPRPAVPPPAPPPARDTRILCRDGTYWPSSTRQGACSGRGGIMPGY